MTKVVKDIEEVSKYDTSSQSRRGLLINSLIRFFDIRENLDKFLQVINGKGDISLRLLDWLITNYSKSHNIIYNINIGGVDKQMNIYLNYKTQLKAYSKRQFDPFQRRERISFEVEVGEGEKQKIVTTIGQLNFFRWAIQNNILEYASEHITAIEKDMNNSIQLRKESNSKQRNKRKDVSSTIIQQFPQNQVVFS